MGAAESVVLTRRGSQSYRTIVATDVKGAAVRMLLVTPDGERIDASLSHDQAVAVACELVSGVSQGEPVELNACPPGPFVFKGTLGFKTEYGHCDAYVMASGEAFWGGAITNEQRGRLKVRPCQVMPL